MDCYKPKWLNVFAVLMGLAVISMPAWAIGIGEDLDSRVGDQVYETLRTEPETRVIVLFDVPELKGQQIPRTSSTAQEAIERVGDRILERAWAGGFDVIHQYRSVSALVGNVTGEGLEAILEDPGVLRVDPDLEVAASLDQARPLVDIPQVHQNNIRGRGVTVAVLDTGFDTDHPDLNGDLFGEQCFCSNSSGGCCPDGTSRQFGPGSAEDDNDHGTHVSGIVTSTGSVAPRGGAPAAKILAIKVLGADGRGFSSEIVAALEWIALHRADEVSVINMSLGGGFYSGVCDNEDSRTTAYAQAIDNLRSKGVITFAASGNDASTLFMGAPACVSGAVSVGAVYDTNVGPRSFSSCTDSTTAADQVTCFSNRNAFTDLMAPGAMIRSTKRGGGVVGFAGTSMATPLVAACAALLLEEDPKRTPDGIEAALTGFQSQVTDHVTGLVYPRLDCDLAVEQIFSDDCETGDTSRWSQTLTSCIPGSCNAFPECSGGPGCACAEKFDGEGICISNALCAGLTDCFAGPSDCAAGEVCVVNTCCEVPKCTPTVCTESQALSPSNSSTEPSLRSPGGDELDF